MNIIWINILLLFGCANNLQMKDVALGSCKYKYNNELKKKIYTQVDEMPSFPGGYDMMFEFFIDKMDLVKQEEFQEMIKLDFVIDVDGKIINAKIRDKKLEDYTLWDKEALRVLKIMPLWKVAACKKKKVPFQWSMPLRIHPQ